MIRKVFPLSVNPAGTYAVVIKGLTSYTNQMEKNDFETIHIKILDKEGYLIAMNNVVDTNLRVKFEGTEDYVTCDLDGCTTENQDKDAER